MLSGHFNKPMPALKRVLLFTAAVGSILISVTCASPTAELAGEDEGELRFSRVTASQFSCNRLYNSSVQLVRDCTDADCFLVSAGNRKYHSNKLQAQEWAGLKRALQELATENRLVDEYPEDMGVLLPFADLRRRLCPVRYEVLMYPETVPMLIVHARCANNNATATEKGHKCRQVEQFRQVYQRLPGCETSDAARVPVYVKHFVPVSVNCAAYSV